MIFQAFYCLVIALSKLSILLFYIRVFPSRIFKITSMVLFVFILLTYFIILVLGFLRCLPLNVTWLAWKGDWKGGEVRCKDPYDVILGLGVLNTAQEVPRFSNKTLIYGLVDEQLMWQILSFWSSSCHYHTSSG